MSGAAALGRRKDTSAARAALARRRQRAAHALQPNNTSNAPETSSSSSSSRIPAIPKKANATSTTTTSVERQATTTLKSSSPKRVADPAGSSKYLSPNRQPPNGSLNAAARNRNLSPPGQRQRITSHGTATTTSMTVESGMTPPAIHRANRIERANRSARKLQEQQQRQLNQSMGSSPLRSTPMRLPQQQQQQQVIHYSTTQPKGETAGANNISSMGTPTTGTSTGTSISTAAPRTSSAVLNARLKARYQSPSHSKGRGSLPPTASKTTAAAAAAVSTPATVTAGVSSDATKTSNHRPPPPAASKNHRLPSKPPKALNQHVANKPPMARTSTTTKPSATSRNLTVNTSAATSTPATNTSRVIAASPRRSAVRDRMTSNQSSSSNEAVTPSAANTSSKQQRMPTPTNIPVTSSSQPSPNKQQHHQQNSTSSPSKKTSTRPTMSTKRQEQMSQRLAQRAIDANRPKKILSSNNNHVGVQSQPPQPTPKQHQQQQQYQLQQPPRVSPPKEFGTISTFLMNDMSMLDTSTNNLLDTTLPPVETTPTHIAVGKVVVPSAAVSKDNEDAVAAAVNQSILLEDAHQQPITTTTTTTAAWSLDASCLLNHSEIMLRSCSTKKTIQREKDDYNDLSDDPMIDDSALNCRALGLGTPEETLSIEKVDVATTAAVSPELRHGDAIRIVTGSSHAMGAYRNERYGLTLLFLPIFASQQQREEEEDTIWQVFVADPGKKLLVGRAAVESLKDDNTNDKLGEPIRAGVPIVLRHLTTGGVLSMSDHGSLTLLTDSFGQSDVILESMEQLQHHDKLLPNKNQTFQFIPLASPPCPTWALSGDGEKESRIDERIYLTSSYLLHPNRRQAEFESQMQLSKQDRMEMTSKVKEKILIEEVIGSFLGLEGRHIRIQQGEAAAATANTAAPSFHLSGTDGVNFEMSLHHLVEQILPMSTSYVRVQHFVTSHHPGYNHGRVMQAFCEGLDTLVQDYVDFVVQLERQHRNSGSSEASSSSLLTMKNIFFQISPWLHSMAILEHATRAVRETKGGALINSLWSLERQVYMGDMVAKKVLGILLEKASMPYLDMMAEWLESGRLNDPFREFMVQQSSTNEFDATQFDGDDWMAMFGIDEENILEGVTSDTWTKEKILTTGKYWNAVHACQVDVDAFMDGNPPKIPKLPFNSDSSAIVAYIDSMYQSASRVLVQLMKEKFKLTESMDVMKRYFLLDQGDFVMNFLDAAEDELQKKASEVSVGRVQNWLNASIQMTEQHRTNDDDDEEEFRPLVPQALRCRFSAKSLISFLESRHGSMREKVPLTPSRNAYPESTSGSTGIEVFVIDLSYIPFPISLVLSHHAMDKYKLLFRHLLFTKHVERCLIRVWRDHQILKKLGALRGLLGPTFLLRQRMLHFVQNFLYYMSFEVIENNWVEMMNSINSNESKENQQQTVDDILQVHDAFLDRTLDACLLTNRDLIKSLTKLLNTVLLFTNQMKRFMDATRIHDDSTILAAEKQLKVQRNLNERGITPGGAKRKMIRRELASTQREREALNERQTRRVGREVVSESYQRMVGRFGEVFNSDVSDFMKELNRHTASGLVANLGVRLDYNGFVTSSIR